MLFNSFQFLLFFIVTASIYYLIGHNYRWILLLAASCIFYMYFIPIYILILFLTIIIDYFAGILIEETEGKKKKYFLILSIFTNITILAIFKYYNFFIDNLNWLNSSGNNFSYLPIILPIGLSFHTFQAMSYTIEVYRGNQKAEKHFGIYALYVMFFPQLVAGPIERPQNIIHQFHEHKKFNYDNIFTGLKIILLGIFKKVVIADRLAIIVDEVYNHPSNYQGFAFIIASVFFAFQIYCDFSGYSDIAIGTAKILGFNLMINFRQPYFSKNISEFWTRWHISLSTWFKDYLYIPLGGNRVSKERLYFNIILVFLISGFWHGANWTFIIWGAIHGVLLIINNFKIFQKLNTHYVIKVLITFLLVTFAWIFFRASSVNDAFYVISKIFYYIDNPNYWMLSKPDIHGLPSSYLGLPFWKFSFTFMLIPILLIIDWLILKKYLEKTNSMKSIITFPIYFILIISILVFGVFETKQFIYFQF